LFRTFLTSLFLLAATFFVVAVAAAPAATISASDVVPEASSTLDFNPLYVADTFEIVCVYVVTWVVKVDFSAVVQERASDTADRILAMVATVDDEGESLAIVRSVVLSVTKSLQVETLVALFLMIVLLPVELPARVLVLFFAAPRASTLALVCAAFTLRDSALW
jgi:hypothetical protein